MNPEIRRALEHSKPLEPVPTGASKRLARLPGIRAVLFDLYGTLLVSASGERHISDPNALSEAWKDVSGERLPPPTAERATALLKERIEAAHSRQRAQGIEHGEVDIRNIWKDVLLGLVRESRLSAELAAKAEPGALAIQYEARTNPTWPMPGARACLTSLHRRGSILGIISNAQFFSIELFEALMEMPLSELGIDRKLVYCSYEHGEAKPALKMYRLAQEELERRGISPEGALFVGNDMLNDVAAARKVGFRTALFAGDARSLRWREGHPRVQGITPDLVLTRLEDLPDCMG